MSTATLPQPAVGQGLKPTEPTEVRVYSRSALFYWWPVWATGFIMALLTYMQGEKTPFADATVIIHPSKGVGVIYCAVFLLVLLITHATVRGVASLTVLITMLAGVFFFAYMGWWDDIFQAVDGLALYMNLGFYLSFSLAIFLMWALAFFVFDRFNYWTFRPGQAVHHLLMGGGEQTYDTHGMSVHKLRDDLFRHWILGIGSGDLHVSTSGAKTAEFVLHNILFVGSKLERVQQLVAMKPDETPQHVVVAGEP